MADPSGTQPPSTAPRLLVATLLAVLTLLTALIAWERWQAMGERRATAAAIQAHRDRAKAAAGAGDLAQAFLALEAARALRPSDPSLQADLMRMRVRAAAEQPHTLRSADVPLVRYALAATGKETPEGRVAAAQLALREGRIAGAEKLIDQALASDESYVPAHLARATLSRRQGKPAEARRAYERALELDPRHEMALNNLGVVQLELGQAEEAIETLERALEVRDTAAVRTNLGNALARLERTAEAVEHLRRAADLKPHSASVWQQLGAALSRHGDNPGAEAALSRSLELDPAPSTAYSLALVLQEQKAYARAAEVLRQVLEADPRHLDASYQLGATLQALGDRRGAVSVLRSYLALSEGVPTEAERRAQVQAALRPPPATRPNSLSE